jgi:hypothetical protein
VTSFASALARRAEGAHKKPTEFSGVGGLVVISELKDRKRTVFALVTASVISLVLWGLVIALNVR